MTEKCTFKLLRSAVAVTAASSGRKWRSMQL